MSIDIESALAAAKSAPPPGAHARSRHYYNEIAPVISTLIRKGYTVKGACEWTRIQGFWPEPGQEGTEIEFQSFYRSMVNRFPKNPVKTGGQKESV